jgi:hypothetical protein
VPLGDSSLVIGTTVCAPQVERQTAARAVRAAG